MNYATVIKADILYTFFLYFPLDWNFALCEYRDEKEEHRKGEKDARKSGKCDYTER